ncbi:hypothetical protein CRG98_041907, partial [Punica granatum]
MALQAAALVPSAFSIPKEGKSGKDSSFFGVSFADHLKADLSCSSLSSKRERSFRNGAVRAETIAATPSVTRAAPA